MECPKCKTKMEKGFFGDGFWGSGDKPTMASLTKFIGRETIWVIAWRCPNCRYVELQSEK